MGSRGDAIVVALMLAAGCGRTGLLSLPPDASAGAGNGRDAGSVGGTADAGPVVHGDSRDGAVADAVDGAGHLRRITKIAAGSYTACALKADGTVMCWAAWDDRATGISNATQVADVAVIAGEREPPYPYNPSTRGWDDFCVATPAGVACSRGSGLARTMDVDAISLSVGVDQTCAISRDGRVSCDGAAADLDPIREAAHAQGGSLAPVDVPALRDAVRVSAGDGQVCALFVGGQTSCFGRVVHDAVVTDAPLPQTMAVPAALDLSAADEHYCVVTTEGEVVCRGCFYNGGSGGPYFSCGSDDADLAAFGHRRARQVRTSYTHRCVRLDGGAVRCWGNNDYGELGYDSPNAPAPMRDVEGVSDVTDIAVGVHFSCALTATDDVYCWGGALRASPRDKPNLRRITGL